MLDDAAIPWCLCVDVKVSLEVDRTCRNNTFCTSTITLCTVFENLNYRAFKVQNMRQLELVVCKMNV